MPAKAIVSLLSRWCNKRNRCAKADNCLSRVARPHCFAFVKACFPFLRSGASPRPQAQIGRSKGRRPTLAGKISSRSGEQRRLLGGGAAGGNAFERVPQCRVAAAALVDREV